MNILAIGGPRRFVKTDRLLVIEPRTKAKRDEADNGAVGIYSPHCDAVERARVGTSLVRMSHVPAFRRDVVVRGVLDHR